MSDINNTYPQPVDIFALGNMNSIADMGVMANTAGALQFISASPPPPPPVDSDYNPAQNANVAETRQPVKVVLPVVVAAQGSGNDNVQGTSGNDDLNGLEGDDNVYGNEGDDQVRGGKGNDSVYGGKGNDRVFGDNGDDRLSGDRGDDVIDGGEGNDTASFSGSISNYTITREGAGFRVVDNRPGEDGSDFVTNVESFNFGGQGYSANGLIEAATPAPVVVPEQVVAPAVVPVTGGEAAVETRQPVKVVLPPVLPVAVAAPSARSQLGWTDAQALSYIASHPDLMKAFGANPEEGARHYLNHGKGEGRTTTFDPATYLAANPDVVAVLGNDLAVAPRHYIQYGRFENRDGTGAAAVAATPATVAAAAPAAPAGMNWTEEGPDRDFFGLTAVNTGDGGTLDLEKQELPQGAPLTHDIIPLGEDTIFVFEPEPETPALGGKAIATTGGGQSTGGSGNNVFYTAGKGTTIAGDDNDVITGGSGSDFGIGGAGNDLISTGDKPRNNGQTLTIDNKYPGSIIIEGYDFETKFPTKAYLSAAATPSPAPAALSKGVGDSGPVVNDTDMAASLGTGPVGSAFANMIKGNGSTVIAMRINDKQNPQNSPVFSFVLSAAHLAKGDYTGALANATMFASIPMPLYQKPLKFSLELKTGKFNADVADENPISAYGGKKGDAPQVLLLRSVPELSRNLSDGDKISGSASSAALVAITGATKLEDLVTNIVGKLMYNNIILDGYQSDKLQFGKSANLVLSKYLQDPNKYEKTMYAGPGFKENIIVNKNGIYLGNSNITREISNLANKPQNSINSYGKKITENIKIASSNVIQPSSQPNLRISINTQLVNLLSTPGRSSSVGEGNYRLFSKEWVIAGASSILDDKVDSFALAKFAKRAYDFFPEGTTSPQTTNAMYIYTSPDPRSKIARLFIKAMYSVGRHGKELFLQGTTPDQQARFFGAIAQDQWMLRDLNAFGKLSIDNIPAIVKNMKSKLGGPEGEARVDAFCRQVVLMGYGNVTFGDPLMAAAMKKARQSLPQAGANNDAKKVADYFNQKDMRDNLDFDAWNSSSANPTPAGSTPMTLDGKLEEPVIGTPSLKSELDRVNLSPQKKMLSENELANFSTNGHTKDLALMLNGLASAPLSVREMYYVHGPGKNQTIPKDVSDLIAKRKVIIDSFNNSGKRFEDTVNMLNRRIRLEPVFATVLKSLLILNDLDIAKGNANSKYVSALDIPIAPMSKIEALDNLRRMPPFPAVKPVSANSIKDAIWNYLRNTSPFEILDKSPLGLIRRKAVEVTSDIKTKIVGSLSQHDFEPGIYAGVKTPNLLYDPGAAPKNSPDYYKNLIGADYPEGGPELAGNPEVETDPATNGPEEVALLTESKDWANHIMSGTDPDAPANPGDVATVNAESDKVEPVSQFAPPNEPQPTVVATNMNNNYNLQKDWEMRKLKETNPALWVALQPQTYSYS